MEHINMPSASQSKAFDWWASCEIRDNVWARSWSCHDVRRPTCHRSRSTKYCTSQVYDINKRECWLSVFVSRKVNAPSHFLATVLSCSPLAGRAGNRPLTF